MHLIFIKKEEQEAINVQHIEKLICETLFFN